MSVVQSGSDLGLTNLTPELSKPIDTANNGTLKAEEAKKVDKVNSESQSLNEQAQKQKPLTTQQLEKVAQQLQDFVGDMNRGLEFSVDKDSGRDVIKVIDRSSGDLVKQFPSEEVLTLVAKLSEMVGGFVDAKV